MSTSLALFPLLLLLVPTLVQSRVVTSDIQKSECEVVKGVKVTTGHSGSHITYVTSRCGGSHTLATHFCPKDETCQLSYSSDAAVVSSFDTNADPHSDNLMTAYTSEGSVYFRRSDSWKLVESSNPDHVSTAIVGNSLFALWSEGDSRIRFHLLGQSNNVVYSLVEDCHSCKSARVRYISKVDILLVTMLQGTQNLLMMLIDPHTGIITTKTSKTINPHTHEYGGYDAALLSDGQTVAVSVPIKNSFGKWELYMTAVRVIERTEVVHNFVDDIVTTPSTMEEMKVKLAALDDGKYLVGYEFFGAIRFFGGHVPADSFSISMFDVQGRFGLGTITTTEFDVMGLGSGFVVSYVNKNELLYYEIEDAAVFASATPVPETPVPETPEPSPAHPTSYNESDGRIGTLLILIAIVMPIVFVSGLSIVIWVCCCYGKDNVVEVKNSTPEPTTYTHKTIGLAVPEASILSPYPQSIGDLPILSPAK
eukprot:TRINITY_DN4077_c1_g1_i1.p1 TRINITY_DN4077_c1_g1~~TRINITY_DN4077_c1_g1_i1.p1  ORF type:complete len:479 (+),score=67.22 TRINITY_DN4077_c1_g1_i1:46-1482(+)